MRRKTLGIAAALVLVTCGVASAGWDPPKNVGANVNTSSAERAPYVDPAGTKMYFASNRPGGAGGFDLYVSTWTGSAWGRGYPVGAPVNTTANESGPGLNGAGTTLFLASDRAGGYGGYDLWSSARSGNGWTACVNLGSDVNSASADTDPWSNANGTRVYFSSNRSGGYGGYDLYYSVYSSGRWQAPVNLGYRINSTADEYAPNLSSDGRRLYFYSTRAGGRGSDDIWVSELVGGNWQPPLNLGSVINSSLSERSPTVTTGDEFLYLEINGKTGGYGGPDIWSSQSNEVGVEATTLGRVRAIYR